jgi:hypothetical protein
MVLLIAILGVEREREREDRGERCICVLGASNSLCNNEGLVAFLGQS